MDYKPLTVHFVDLSGMHIQVVETSSIHVLGPKRLSRFVLGDDFHRSHLWSAWWNVHIYRLVYGTHPGFPSLIHTLFILSFFFSFFLFFFLAFLLSFFHFCLSFFCSFFLSSLFVPSFVPSLIHPFIHSFIRSFVPSFLHSFLPSFIHSFSHLCADSLMSLISCYFIGISTTIYSFVDAPHKFNLSLLLHPTDIPVSKNISCRHCFLSKFPPGHGRALSGIIGIISLQQMISFISSISSISLLSLINIVKTSNT